MDLALVDLALVDVLAGALLDLLVAALVDLPLDLALVDALLDLLVDLALVAALAAALVVHHFATLRALLELASCQSRSPRPRQLLRR